ncbi:MAG: 4'-phosphopantetheinyl transferase superfamily protein [Deltaproteobacteria bacterium]|nr:4'-phosphopantetheinyl transferase superfamily protein [Deltaproteobacteria bacterium]
MSVVGIGIDLVKIERVEAIWSVRRARFVARLLHANERADSATDAACAFALKEATAKALGQGLFAWPLHDVRARSAGGRWSVDLAGRARETADSMGVTKWHIDVCVHEGWATALVVAECKDGVNA